MSESSSDRRKSMLAVTQYGGFTKVIEVNKPDRSGSGVSVFQDRDVNTSTNRSTREPSKNRSSGIISPSATARKSGRNIPAPTTHRTPTTTPLPTTASLSTREGSVFSSNKPCLYDDSKTTSLTQSEFYSSTNSYQHQHQHQPVTTPRKHRVITTPVKAGSSSDLSFRNSVTAPERRRSVPAPPPPPPTQQQCNSKKSSQHDAGTNNTTDRWKYSSSDLSSSHSSEQSDTLLSTSTPAPTASDDRRLHSLTTRLQNAELRAAALSDEKVDLEFKLSAKERECRLLSQQLNDKEEPIPHIPASKTVKAELRDQPTQTDAASRRSAEQSSQTTQLEPERSKSASAESSSSPEEVARLRETVAMLESVICSASDDSQVSESEMRARLLDVVKKSLSEKEALTRKLYSLEIQHKKDRISHDSVCDDYEAKLSELRAEVATLRCNYRKRESTPTTPLNSKQP